MEGLIQVIGQIETPLQLAALALLVLYGVSRALIGTNRWQPSDITVRLFVNRFYQLATVAFVLAVGGPLLLKVLHPDVFIEGSVFSTAGTPLDNALVNVVAIGSQAVHADGTFEIRIPNHLRRKQYSVGATAEGFKPETKVVAASDLNSIDFRLTPQPERVIRQISPDVVIAQFYGLPAVVVSIRAKNPSSSQRLTHN